MPLKPSHNLLVRGSNPCGGTNQLASCLTFTSSCCWANSCSTSRWREDGAICALPTGARASSPALSAQRERELPVLVTRDRRVMRSVPSALADGFDTPLRLNLTTFPSLV